MMTTPINAAAAQQPKARARVPTESRYPVYSLEDSVEVARLIHENGGGAAAPDQLAGFLKYSTTNSGTYLSRIAAARLFGMIENSGRDLVPSHLALRIIHPEYPQDQADAQVDAFLTVPLYRTLYQRYEGQALPPEVGLRNAMRTVYSIPEGRTPAANRGVMESAEQAGFFSTRGARSHLVKPTSRAPQTAGSAEATDVAGEAQGDFGGGRGGSGGGGRGGGSGSGGWPQTPAVAGTMHEVRAEYVRQLIAMLGEEEERAERVLLMARIERLVGESTDLDTG